MTCYARVLFYGNACATERHEDVNRARKWIEAERDAHPELFRLGQIIQAAPTRECVATCDAQGWIATPTGLQR